MCNFACVYLFCCCCMVVCGFIEYVCVCGFVLLLGYNFFFSVSATFQFTLLIFFPLLSFKRAQYSPFELR